MATTEPDTIEGGALPSTTYAVLGMLSFGEFSGYDLLKAVEGSVAFFWSPAKSQVYSELRRLVRLGYATAREVEQERRPDKRVFAITPAGERALDRWLADPTQEADVVRSTFLLKLFFAHRLDGRAVRGQIRERRDEASATLEEFLGIERRILEGGGGRYPHLTLKYGMAYQRAVIRWCDQALRELGEGR